MQIFCVISIHKVSEFHHIGISTYILCKSCKRILQSPDLLHNHKTLVKNMEIFEVLTC